MSLELAINENTAAVKALAELMAKLSSGAMQVATRTAEVIEVKAEAKTEKTKTSAAKTNLTAETEAASAQVKADAVQVTYDEVKKAIVAYQQAKGREATIAALGELGVTKGTDLKPEQYAEALAKFTA